MSFHFIYICRHLYHLWLYVSVNLVRLTLTVFADIFSAAEPVFSLEQIELLEFLKQLALSSILTLFDWLDFHGKRSPWAHKTDVTILISKS